MKTVYCEICDRETQPLIHDGVVGVCEDCQEDAYNQLQAQMDAAQDEANAEHEALELVTAHDLGCDHDIAGYGECPW